LAAACTDRAYKHARRHGTATAVLILARSLPVLADLVEAAGPQPADLPDLDFEAAGDPADAGSPRS